jgi:hypothetical protein
LGDSRRPAGGVFDGGTGIGASGFVGELDEEEADGWLFVVAPERADAPICAGRGALPSEPAAACAAAGSAQPNAHAIGTSRRRITRA